MRAENRHHSARVIRNRLVLIRQSAVNFSAWVLRLEREGHRLNKRHPYDCGKSDCQLCSRPGYDRQRWRHKCVKLEDESD